MINSHQGAQRARHGFTLVELLVVIGMIAILAGMLLPVLGKAQDSSRRKADQLTLQGLATALTLYEQAYQDFPPSQLVKVGVKGANPINQGIEVLVATLSSTKKGLPYYEFDDDKLQNTDGDKAKGNLFQFTGGFNKPELYEIVDEFGSPFVYVHHRDYSKLGDSARYRNEYGEDSTIVCTKSEKTGEWFGMGTFQMWGFGPNLQNENGGGDDVVSW